MKQVATDYASGNRDRISRATYDDIIEKLEEKNIPYWVTKGREIENYLDLSSEGIQLGQFDKLGNIPKMSNYDKINFAKQYYQEVDFEKYDLRSSINKLATEIKKWNDKR